MKSCIKGFETYEAKDREDLSVKSLTDDGTFTGYASVFGKVDLQDDVVEEGAFARTIKHHDGMFPLLWQHNPDAPIGIVTVKEDSKGLKVDPGKILLDVTQGSDAYKLAKAKIVKGMSIGYKTVKELWDRANGTRRLKEVALLEISLVTFPANEGATIRNIKSMSAGAREFLSEIEGEDGIDKQILAVKTLEFFSDEHDFAEEKEAVKDMLTRSWKKLGLTPPWEPVANLDEYLETQKFLDQAMREKDLSIHLSEDLDPSDDTPFEWKDDEPKLDLADAFAWIADMNKKG